MNREAINIEQLDYGEIVKKHPWILGTNQNYILSPDSDGFLCGLLLTNILGGKIIGFYDGKLALIKDGINAKDCIFLDVDINRTQIRSIGHHMVTYNKKLSVQNHNYSNCIQPNIIRNFDGKSNFQSKYPFGTIHLLLGIFQNVGIIQNLTKDAIWPLLFTDGVWNNLFGYTENCINWINYLGVADKDHILNPLFCSMHYSFYEIMLGLNDFLRMRDSFNASGYSGEDEVYNDGGRNKRTGDKLRISNTQGSPINIIKSDKLFNIQSKEKIRTEGFIVSMSKYVGWEYRAENWSWKDFRLLKFTKGDFSGIPLNNQTYEKLMSKNPLSMAMTSGMDIEYTLETPDKLI